MRQYIYIIILLGCFFCSGNFFRSGQVLFAEELEPSKLEYTSSNTRDPFEKQLPKEPLDLGSKLPSEEIVPPGIVVDGLIAGGPIPQALISGQIFRIGDKVQEADITNITKEGVEVLYKGKTFSYPAPSKALMPTKGGEDEK